MTRRQEQALAELERDVPDLTGAIAKYPESRRMFLLLAELPTPWPRVMRWALRHEGAEGFILSGKAAVAEANAVRRRQRAERRREARKRAEEPTR